MADKTNITAELEALQLEEAREAAEQRKQKRANREARRKVIEQTIRRDEAAQRRIQTSCAHKKGGRGTAQLYMGNDTNYAVVQHTSSIGETIVICQRCGKLWRPPEPLPKKPTAEEKAAYVEAYNEYRRALNFPTDNMPSGSQLFTITRNDEAVA